MARRDRGRKGTQGTGARPSLLVDPEKLRITANEAFVATELERSREFLDRVEARPLSDEQRRAVAVDDDRNLVVAAAGSGKTSVMVAKAGWLAESERRQPDEVLLLAFAKKARDELAERVASRLGPDASEMRLRTFHSLGLEIIGEAEGRKPALARTADDPKALLDHLKDVFGQLLVDGEHGRRLVQWLAYGSAPYRAEHEFAFAVREGAARGALPDRGIRSRTDGRRALPVVPGGALCATAGRGGERVLRLLELSLLRAYAAAVS